MLVPKVEFPGRESDGVLAGPRGFAKFDLFLTVPLVVNCDIARLFRSEPQRAGSGRSYSSPSTIHPSGRCLQWAPGWVRKAPIS